MFETICTALFSKVIWPVSEPIVLILYRISSPNGPKTYAVKKKQHGLAVSSQEMASGLKWPVSPRLRSDTLPLGRIVIHVMPQWLMLMRSQPSGGNWSALQEQKTMHAFLLNPFNLSSLPRSNLLLNAWSEKLCSRTRRMYKLIKLSWEFDGQLISPNEDKGKVSMYVRRIWNRSSSLGTLDTKSSLHAISQSKEKSAGSVVISGLPSFW